MILYQDNIITIIKGSNSEDKIIIDFEDTNTILSIYIQI